MNEQALHIDRLAVGYRRHKLRTVAAGLTASAATGTVTALIGRNGSGKSTLLRTLAGLQPALGGEIRLMGRAIGDYSATALARTVAVVLTERIEADGLTAEEIVGMGRLPYTPFDGRLSATDRDHVRRAMAATDTTALAHRAITRLSDGERQRVMIAKALAQETPIILLDEPTAFLDFPAKVETMRLLHRLSRTRGKAILLSTHDLSIALPMADHIWLVNTGHLTEGAPQALATDGTLGRQFAAEGIAFDPRTLQYSIL